MTPIEAIAKAAAWAGVPIADLPRDKYQQAYREGLVDVSLRQVLKPGGGSWRKARDLAAAQHVDVTALDWDDEVTAPATPIEPRLAEPREVLEARRARDAATDLRRQLDAALRELELAESRGHVLDALHAAKPPGPIVPRETRGREATAVALLSDWHVEESISAAEIQYRNAYSPQIARHRVERLAEGILWLVAMHRERFAIRDLVLALMGDLITGYIHEELEETNALTPPEAVLFAQELIRATIDALLQHGGFERIVVPCLSGNHGRTTKRRRVKHRAFNSYEFLIYHNLADHYRNEPRVEVQVGTGAHLYLDVLGTTIRFHHGDDVNYWGGVGGLTIPLNKAIRSWQSFQRADLTCVGHFHQYLHGRDFVVNGSLIGYSEFALAIKAEYEDPAQAFFLIDSKRGRTCKSPIWVEDSDRDWRAA